MVDDLALTYNDLSPMENHHIAAAFRLLRSPDYNFLRRMPREKMVGGGPPGLGWGCGGCCSCLRLYKLLQAEHISTHPPTLMLHRCG